MTREEAIEILNRDDDSMRKGYFCINDFKAIEVLKSEEPCEDCISRQDVKELFQEGCVMGMYDFLGIDDIPSVTPQPRIGQWIEVIEKIKDLEKTWHYKCSICGNEDSGWGNYKYCPNCGAKIEVKE